MNSTDLKQRSQSWDILKLLLIFLVVLGHMADYYTNKCESMRALYLFLYTFHMPVFFFVSGLFAKRTINEKRKEKIFGYLILFLFMKAIEFSLKMIDGQNPQFRLFYGDGFSWYLLVLALSVMITMLIKNISPKFVLIFSAFLACFAGFDNSLGSFLSLSRLIVLYPFFFLGYCLERDTVEEFFSKKILKAAAPIIILLFGIVVFTKSEDIYWLRPLVTGTCSFHEIGVDSLMGAVIRLLYYLVVLLVGGSVIALIPQKNKLGKAAKFGQRTLSVYVFHYIILFLLFNKLNVISFFESIIPRYSEWMIIPLSVVTTVLLSFKPLNDLLIKIMNVPLKD